MFDLNKIMFFGLMVFSSSAVLTHAETPYKDIPIDSAQYRLGEIGQISNQYIVDLKKPKSEAYYNASETAIKKYKKIIQTVRSKNQSKVDEKLWQNINLQFNALIKDCRNLGYSEVSYLQPLLPASDCEVVSYYNFAITTVKLHMDQ